MFWYCRQNDAGALLAGVVFLVVLISQATFTADVIRELKGEYPDTPIALGDSWPTISNVAYGGSVRVGDLLILYTGGESARG